MSRLNSITEQNKKDAEIDLSSKIRNAKKKILDDPEPASVIDRPARTSSSERKPVKPKDRRKTLLKTCVIIGILVLVAAFLYVPQFFMKDSGQEMTKVPYDVDGINYSATALRQNPDADFDKDGINNSDETTRGTDPYKDDTDSDGVSDYAEVYLTKTNPVVYEDTLKNNAAQKDKEAGNSLSTSYRVGNVLMWADNYDSKGNGSVVETEKGYRFCSFDGYAQFPKYENWYAYAVTEKGHTLLPYREEEQVWEIHSDNVELFKEPQEKAVYLNAFGLETSLADNFATRILAFLLPDKGFITSYPCLQIDAEPEVGDAILAKIQKPEYQKDDLSRFTKTTTSLRDLGFLRNCIDENRCVAVSLYHDSVGEYIGIIYGYSGNELYVADPETMQHIGTIQITECARMFMDKNGAVMSKEYFTFRAFGFTSENGSRINFFRYGEKEKEPETQNPEPESEKPTEPETKEPETKEPETETTTKEEETTTAAEPVTQAPANNEPEGSYYYYEPPVYYPPAPEPEPTPTVPGNSGVTIIN